MRFVDRDNEIKRLEKAINNSGPSQFVVIYGRRRLGKSTLIRRVLTNSDIYYMADMTEQSQQISMLSRIIAYKFEGFDKVVYPDWDSLIVSLKHRTTERFTICFDEFPYMVKSNSALPSILQRHIDTKDLPFNIIICGSSQQMMHSMVLDSASPLYGRSDVVIKLEPIPIKYIQEVLDLDAIQTIEEYAVWGGVPRYWELREKESSLVSAIESNLFDVNGTLYDEPSKLFLDDFQQTALSSSIISLIGNGVNRLSEIAARLQKKATDLSNPIAKLIQLGYIEREIPFGEDFRNSKKSFYQLCDPFLSIYHKYVVPNRSLIGLGRKKLLMQIFNQSFNEFVGHYWERLCRNVVSGNELLGTTWNIASRWWGNVRDGGKSRMIEIDVVAESFDKKKLLIGECKWTEKENASRLLYELQNKAKLLPFVKDKEIVYVLFLKHNPEDSNAENIILPENILTIKN